MPTFTLAPQGVRLAALLLLTTLLSGCGINNIPTYDEQVKAAWAQYRKLAAAGAKTPAELIAAHGA